jgi:tetratricopeptide (TPR) repeat protein
MKTLKIAIMISLLVTLACGGVAKRKSVEPTKQQTDQFASYQAYEHFVQADLYEENGALDSAAVEYRRALIYDPGSTEIKRSLSEVDFRMKKFDEAGVLRSEISEKNADDYNFIGDCLRFTDDLKGAGDYYQRSLEMDSTQYIPRFYLARIMQYLGKNDLAEKEYIALTRFSPDKVSSLMDLASFYIKINRLDKAIVAFSQAANADTSDARPVVGMGSIYIAKGDTAKADSLYLTLADRNWDDAEYLSSLIPLFFGTNDLDDAEKLAGRVVELAPDNFDAQKRYSMILFGNKKTAQAESLMTILDQKGQADGAIYYYLGRIKEEKKEYPAAEQYLRKSLALVDTMTETWVDLALVIDDQGKYPDAIGLMAEAMQTMSQDSNAILFYTAIIHAKNQHFDLARDGYQRLLKNDPKNMQVKFNLAAAYERLGQFDDAESQFKAIIDKEPNNAMALNYLGYMYAEKGIHLKEARGMLEKALSLDSNNGAYLDSYAWVLYKMGRYDEALVQMQKALKANEPDPTLYDHQGDIYMALNQIDMAHEYWNKALELKPDNDAIRAKLNQK